jgi:signal transduction histidine kinase
MSSRNAQAWCRHTLIVHRLVATVAGTGVLFCLGLAVAHMTSRQFHVLPAAYGIAAVVYACFAVAAVLSWPPWVPVGLALAGTVASLAAGSSFALLAPGLLVSVFAFSLQCDKTPALAGTSAVIGILVIGAALSGNLTTSRVSTLPTVPWLALAAAIGQATRSKRAHVALLEERARRAEEGREEEAQRRVQAERLRIARDLHDAVGHHVALISVQAGAMGYLFGADLDSRSQDKARESLGHIQRASESALEELRLTVGLLRQPDDVEPLEPTGGLARLGELTEAFTATGLEVACEVTGDARPLPEAVDLTAYRVIQESLTNVSKHAVGSSATVSLGYGPGWLRLAVTNDGEEHGTTGEGHGIIGMRERAATVGGWLTAGPVSGGGFQVLAELPASAP